SKRLACQACPFASDHPARSGKLGAGFEFEDQFFALYVDVNHTAMLGQLAKQDFFRQGPLDLVLDQARHGPRTHLRIVAALGEPATRRIRDLERHVLVLELRLQLDQELVDDALDHFMAQAAKLDDGVQAVAEFGREALLDHLHRIRSMILMGEAYRRTRSRLGAGIGGHDENHVAEIRLASVVVGKRSVVHDLQQQVEYLGVSLYYLVQQQHAVRPFGNRLGQQTTLVETDVARRRADQPRIGVAIHVFGHIEANQLDSQRTRQLAGRFGLADTSGACKQEGADRLVRRFQACPGKLDCRRQGIDRIVLAKYRELEVTLQVAQQFLVRGADMLGRNARNLRHDVLDLLDIDAFDAFLLVQQALVGRRFVDHVDRLVRHQTIIDVARCQLGRGTKRLVAVFDLVMLLEAPLQAAQDTDGVFDRRFGYVHLLESPRERAIFLEDSAKFLECGGADATDLTGRQQGLEQIGCIQHTAGSRPGADDGMNLIDEQHRMWPLAQ